MYVCMCFYICTNVFEVLGTESCRMTDNSITKQTKTLSAPKTASLYFYKLTSFCDLYIAFSSSSNVKLRLEAVEFVLRFKWTYIHRYAYMSKRELFALYSTICIYLYINIEPIVV